MQAPIVLFVYNRIDHTKSVLQALNQNRDADKSELFIFSDAPANKTEMVNVAEVREYIHFFAEHNSFKVVHITMAQENKGLERSLIDGITSIISQYEKVIVLEDDQLTSPDFIQYMNEALRYYEHDQRIWSVTGFSMDLKSLRHYKRDVYCGCRGCCWGWGTWKDRWDKVDWAVSDYDNFIKDRRKQHEFNKGGMDMTSMLKMQREGKIHSWAIRWCYQQYKERMLTIFPRNSKVKNIGIDGSGTNCGTGSVYRATLKEEENWDFEYDENDDSVFREQRCYYARLFIRQKIGALWYALTEFENCLVYRFKDRESYSVLKPNFKEEYVSATPFYQKGEMALFIVVFHKWSGRSSVSVSRVKPDGTLTQLQSINIKTIKTAVPCVFVLKGQVYMLVTGESEGELYLYIMGNDIMQWKLYGRVEYNRDIMNAVISKGTGGEIYILANEADREVRYRSRLVLFQLDDLDCKERITLKEIWKQEEYSYDVLSGGSILEEEGRQYRIVRNGSAETYSKFITLTELKQVGGQGISESLIKKIGAADIKDGLRPFIYRKQGVSSYSRNIFCEVAGLRVQRFSVGGLLMKVYRLFGGKKGKK